MAEPRKSRWPWIIGALIAFLVLLIVNLNTEDSEERYHRQMWENSLVPCVFDPSTGEPAGLPCRSGDKVYTK
ncbi:MAG: hypothetical protein U0R23_02800 [Candidatus Nanopelagicales bacterium]